MAITTTARMAVRVPDEDRRHRTQTTQREVSAVGAINRTEQPRDGQPAGQGTRPVTEVRAGRIEFRHQRDGTTATDRGGHLSRPPAIASTPSAGAVRDGDRHPVECDDLHREGPAEQPHRYVRTPESGIDRRRLDGPPEGSCGHRMGERAPAHSSDQPISGRRSRRWPPRTTPLPTHTGTRTKAPDRLRNSRRPPRGRRAALRGPPRRRAAAGHPEQRNGHASGNRCLHQSADRDCGDPPRQAWHSGPPQSTVTFSAAAGLEAHVRCHRLDLGEGVRLLVVEEDQSLFLDHGDRVPAWAAEQGVQSSCWSAGASAPRGPPAHPAPGRATRRRWTAAPPARGTVVAAIGPKIPPMAESTRGMESTSSANATSELSSGALEVVAELVSSSSSPHPTTANSGTARTASNVRGHLMPAIVTPAGSRAKGMSFPARPGDVACGLVHGASRPWCWTSGFVAIFAGRDFRESGQRRPIRTDREPQQQAVRPAVVVDSQWWRGQDLNLRPSGYESDGVRTGLSRGVPLPLVPQGI